MNEPRPNQNFMFKYFCSSKPGFAFPQNLSLQSILARVLPFLATQEAGVWRSYVVEYSSSWCSASSYSKNTPVMIKSEGCWKTLQRYSAGRRVEIIGFLVKPSANSSSLPFMISLRSFISVRELWFNFRQPQEYWDVCPLKIHPNKGLSAHMACCLPEEIGASHSSYKNTKKPTLTASWCKHSVAKWWSLETEVNVAKSVRILTAILENCNNCNHNICTRRNQDGSCRWWREIFKMGSCKNMLASGVS